MPQDDPQEAIAFAILADALIRRLDLDSDRRHEVLAELFNERALVRRWLTERGMTAAQVRGV